MSDGFTLFEAWSATISRAAWHGGLAVVIVWLLVRLWPSMPARHRAWLWRLVTLKFAVLLVIAVPVAIPLLPAPEPMELPGDPLTEKADLLAVGSSVLLDENLAPSPIPVPAVSHLGLALVAIWMAVAVAGWGRLIYAAHAVARQRRLCQPLESESIAERRTALARRFGLKTPPPLLEVAGHGSPLLVGVFRPAIVFPAATLRSLSEAERNLALGHELAHAARRDLPWNVFAAVMRSLYWFHPLAWLCEKELRLSQELAADELAVAQGVADPIEYGRSLAAIIEKLSPNGRIPALSLGTAGPMHCLTERIRAMKRMGSGSRYTSYFSLLFVGLTAVAGIVPWQLTAAEAAKNPLLGVWRVADVELEGRHLTDEPLFAEQTPFNVSLKSATWSFKKGTLVMHAGALSLEAPYLVDGEKVEIKMPIAQGNNDASLKGVFSLEGDTLKVCLGQRFVPTKVAAGDSAVLYTLTRVKPRSAPVDRLDAWGASLSLEERRAAKDPFQASAEGVTPTLDASACPSQEHFPLLGERMADTVKRCGEPQSETTLASGIMSRQFHVGTTRVIVEYSPQTQRAVQVYYFMREPLVGLQVNHLLGLNSGGLEWQQPDNPTTQLSFVRSDGSQTRGSSQTPSTHRDGKPEYMFAFLAADEVKKARLPAHQAQAAAEQERKQAEQARKQAEEAAAEAHRQAAQTQERIANGVQAVIENAKAEQPMRMNRLVSVQILKGSQAKPDRDLAINTAIAFHGPRVEATIAKVKTGEKSMKIELAMDVAPGGIPEQYLIETKIINDTDPKKPVILSAPRVMTGEGRPATIAVGSTEDLLQIHLSIEKLDESAKAVK